MSKHTSQFWELMRQSVIVQATMAILFSITVLWMAVKETTIPSEIWLAYGAILGFYFRARTELAAERTARRILDMAKEDAVP